ncbi:hypothetical protein JCM1841_001664 [Sporobolomyces salmonicolor]
MSEPASKTVPVASAATASSSERAPLALPAPPQALADDDPIKLDVNSGESVSLFDKLGPTVVNSDGTLSRIANWAEMGPAERARVLRILGARNQIRLEQKKEELERDEAAGSA